jgi:uncharacterized protein YhdP
MRAERRLLRWLRRLYVTLAIVAAVLVLIRLLIDPVATHFTRKALDDADAIRGDFLRVHVTVFPPGYEIRRIKLIEHPGGDWKRPLFYAERVAIRVDWRELMHARLAARVRLDRPKIDITKRTEKEEAKAAGIPDVHAALQRATPLRIDRIDVRGGELVYRDLTAPRQRELWLHAIRLEVTNLATRRELAKGRRVSVDGRATLGRSGAVTMEGTADPFARKLAFAGKFAVEGWKVAELYDLIEPATDLQTPEGTLDVFAEFKATDGEITGGVKPVLKNVKVRPTDDDFGSKLKAWLADEGFHLFSEKRPEGRAVATVVPIKGRLDDPDVQLWPAVVGVIRNAFVEGVSSGFADLPPPGREQAAGKDRATEEGVEEVRGPAQSPTHAHGHPHGGTVKSSTPSLKR